MLSLLSLPPFCRADEEEFGVSLFAFTPTQTVAFDVAYAMWTAAARAFVHTMFSAL